ncbi:uncharacterized protein BDZ83DRAFT_632734 [Colletotrichum acutatum]|uniref:Uncharacterized protein n=1 Tax=Glomerella acutata TaxID=27357 RepID=A0AAD8UE12_GLOAC|nr:uncharacterized protein BDZ83DRAFT_632734 [Colletotrichum acutatum]KAK1718777.1 hypothetical protein BDZ83DRAFT_632734 [Colletotrichum acutatum]
MLKQTTPRRSTPPVSKPVKKGNEGANRRRDLPDEPLKRRNVQLSHLPAPPNPPALSQAFPSLVSE